MTTTTTEYDPAAQFDALPSFCEDTATMAELVTAASWPRVLVTAHHADRRVTLATYGSLNSAYWRVHPDEDIDAWCRAKLAETPRACDAMIFAPRGGYIRSVKAAR